MQIGMLGLIRAARHYDPQRNFAFSTYAYRSIANEIQTKYNQVKNRHDRYPCRFLSLDSTPLPQTNALTSDTRFDEQVFMKIEVERAQSIARQSGKEREFHLLLRHANGETMAQLGREIGISKEGVRISIKRLTERIKRDMYQ